MFQERSILVPISGENWNAGAGSSLRKCAHNEILARRRARKLHFSNPMIFLEGKVPKILPHLFSFCETGKLVADPFPLVLCGSWDGNYGRMSNESGMREKRRFAQQEDQLRKVSAKICPK